MIDKLTPDKDIVLIVDDTAANHEVIQTFLNDIGVKCENAFDGMEALTMCNSVDNNYYSLILMDINLPHMDGLQTAHKIRQLGITSPIIAITAANKHEDKIKSAESQDIFDLLLFKPFNTSSFYTAISPYIKAATLRSLSPEISSNEYTDFSKLDLEVCDIHTAIENMGNSPRLFMKHFNNFKTNNVDLALRLTDLIENKLFNDAAILCHSIKGLSGMLALTSLYKHIQMLEKLLQANEAKAVERPKNIPEISQMIIYINDDLRLICQLQF